MPPGYTVGRAKSCFRHVRDLILDIKDKNKDAYICIGGDFNQWQIEEALEDYPDIVENQGGPTRKNRTIDRNFSNWSEDIVETAVLPPLETEEIEAGSRSPSDHKNSPYQSGPWESKNAKMNTVYPPSFYKEKFRNLQVMATGSRLESGLSS